MKKALLGAALLIAPFFSLANIYEDANSVNPETTTSCELEKEPSQVVEEFNTGNNLPRRDGTVRYTAAIVTNVNYYDYGNGSCKAQVNYSYKLYRTNTSNGEEYLDRTIGSYTNVYGTVEEVPTCLNHPANQGKPLSEQYTILKKRQDGTSQCYSPKDLAEVDSCEQKDSDGLYESFISSESGVSCMEKPEDGSICPVKKNFEITSNSSGNTSYFYEYDTSTEPSTCYQLNTVTPPQPQNLEIDSQFPNVDGACSESNGISMCNENPLNVCDQNGNCQQGCGSVSFGGQQEFICLSGDIDNDSIPDYQDRDKDGDGIPNEDDLDADGDGIEDPIDTSSNNIRTPHQSSIEQLLGQIAQNTSGGSGGGGSGSSASEIGESVAEEIEEKLVEQADFSGTEYEQSVNAKIEATDTAIDEFLQDDEKDLTNAFDESEFQSSFSTLKTALSPKGCSAQFAIPLTDSTLDLCEPASKAQPFLYVIFAIATFIYCMRRIQSTARSE